MPEEKITLTVPQAPVPQQKQEIIVPTALIPLPSEGKVYPPESPLYNRVAVEIKSMTAREEDILTSRALLKSGKAIPMLVQSCLADRTIDSEQFLAGDRNAVLIGIRVTGYGHDYNVQLQCPTCKGEIKKEIDLRELPIKRFPEGVEPVSLGKNEFEFMLPVSQRRVLFKLMTGADERELLQTVENLRKAGVSEELVTTRLRIQILSIGGETDRSKTVNLIKNMVAKDSRALRSYIDKISPGIDLVTDFMCPLCGEEAKEVEVPLGTEFFWPST